MDNDFSGKDVIPFCTSTSDGIGDSGTLLAEMAGTGNWLEGSRLECKVQKRMVPLTGSTFHTSAVEISVVLVYLVACDLLYLYFHLLEEWYHVYVHVPLVACVCGLSDVALVRERWLAAPFDMKMGTVLTVPFLFDCYVISGSRSCRTAHL